VNEGADQGLKIIDRVADMTGGKSVVLPNYFMAHKQDVREVSSLTIAFPDFTTIARVFNLPQSTVQNHTFRVQKTKKRELRSVQILGFEDQSKSENDAKQRHIIFGRSGNSSRYRTPLEVATLKQNSLAYNDVAFVNGFSFVQEDGAFLSGLDRSSAEHDPLLDFSICWQRLPGFQPLQGTHPKSMLGKAYVRLPVVIIRDKGLAESAVKAVNTMELPLQNNEHSSRSANDIVKESRAYMPVATANNGDISPKNWQAPGRYTAGASDAIMNDSVPSHSQALEPSTQDDSSDATMNDPVPSHSQALEPSMQDDSCDDEAIADWKV